MMVMVLIPDMFVFISLNKIISDGRSWALTLTVRLVMTDLVMVFLYQAMAAL